VEAVEPLVEIGLEEVVVLVEAVLPMTKMLVLLVLETYQAHLHHKAIMVVLQ
jgi:hypothetical protein